MPESPQQPTRPDEQSKAVAGGQERIKALRTFESDIAEALQQEQTSAVTIVTAEQTRPREEATRTVVEPEVRNPERTKFFVTISGIIAATGIIIFIAYLFLKPEDAPPPPITSTGKRIITVDSVAHVNLTGLTFQQSIKAFEEARDSTPVRVGGIAQLIPIQGGIADTGQELSAGAFIKTLSPSVSPSLVRALEPEYAFGLIGFDGNQPFIILRTASYENAYDGLLRSELDFYREAGVLFVGRTPLPGLSTTTIAYYGASLSERVFTDIVIKNVDARAVKDENGSIVFLYGFPDQSTVIITTNQKTFEELIERLKRSRLIR